MALYPWPVYVAALAILAVRRRPWMVAHGLGLSDEVPVLLWGLLQTICLMEALTAITISNPEIVAALVLESLLRGGALVFALVALLLGRRVLAQQNERGARLQVSSVVVLITVSLDLLLVVWALGARP